jgi:hypothetical protein
MWLMQGIAGCLAGASVLAMVVNDDACCLDECVVPAFFASEFAPAGDVLNRAGGV